MTECRVFKLEVFDLNTQNFVELPTVFSTPQLPVSKNSIPQQEDVSKYPYLKGIQLPKIDTNIGQLIGNDVPKAPQPKQVIASIDDLLRNGHARKVPGDRLDCPVGAVWYLPHHPVLNANKPGKVCVVFGCAAKHQGMSLNDQLLQGPDLTYNLVGVLTCF